MPAQDLAAFLSQAPTTTLLLVDDSDPDFARRLSAAAVGEVLLLSELTEPSFRPRSRVVLATPDRARLRQAVGGLPLVGRARAIVCWIAEGAAPLVLHPRREWPPLKSITARSTGDGGFLTVVRFVAPVPVVACLVEFARQAVPGAETTNGGLVVGRAGTRSVPGLDPGALVGVDAAAVAGAAPIVPPDIVVHAASGVVAVHHVIDRAPTLVAGPVQEPIDEMLINPVGFRKDWDRPVGTLRDDGVLLVSDSEIDLSSGVTEHALAGLRDLQGVDVEGVGPGSTMTVAGLAMAGVPVRAHPSQAAAATLGAELSAALSTPVDLDDVLQREEHSVRIRRAALDQHSTLAWRARLAGEAGVRFRAFPSVSMLLATKRPHQLDFALRQVAQQRGADCELILAAHGFDPDAARVREALDGRAVTVLSFPETTLFGDVLAAAAAAASGDALLKIDDDDWYGPDVVHDLLLARRYSGADVVGMPAEFVHLEQLDVTVQRNHPVEVYSRFVAGGTLMLDRGLLRAVGDFRAVRRFVDAQLLAAVAAAGGRIYRTHGLGYILRRNATGHTWGQDPDDFRKEGIVQHEWPGFRPSGLMEVDPRDVPGT